MNAEDLVGLALVATYAGMLAIESLGTGRAWPPVRFWRTRGMAFFVLLMAINAVLPSLLPDGWRAQALLPGAQLGVAGGLVAGFVVMTLVNALVHRAYHRFDPLWRWVHQLHHSAPRLDVSGAVLFTPQEMAIGVLLFQAVVVFGLGLDPLAAALLGYVLAFYGLFQHLNLRTPQWLGFLIQRPESHGVHHRRGLHGYNYADFPLWDMLMGTFRNPRAFNGEVGFEDGASPRVLPMMLGRDANAPLYGAASRGSRSVQENPA